MGYVIPFATFGVAVVALFVWGLRDKRKREEAEEVARPHKAA
jgi:hypothetical protein